ncbi:MAG TPA: GNAT family N-acetyltransferase [Terriglobales bacterium]|nr:GNAT family N-acetyltransferase [Terriglobales bacterium]
MLSIRPATKQDVPVILDLIRGLAEYEREPNAVVATEADIIRDGFSDNPRFECLIAEWAGKSAGFAFYFFHYSTWLGKSGLYPEDLFVRPELRGKGIGKALLAHLAGIAVREHCYGMRWQVLDWNQPAIDFYEKLGAKVSKQWLDVRLSGSALESLAKSSSLRSHGAKQS